MKLGYSGRAAWQATWLNVLLVFLLAETSSSLTAQEGVIATDSFSAQAVKYSPDGSLIAIASNRGIDVFDAISGKQVHQLDSERYCRVLTFSPDGRSIVAVRDGPPPAGLLNESFSWQFSGESGTAVSIGNTSQDISIYEVSFSPRYEQLFLVTREKLTNGYDSLIQSITGIDDAIEHVKVNNKTLRSLRFIDEGQTAMVLEAATTINVYDVSDWSLIRQIQLENGTATSLDDANRKILAIGFRETAEDAKRKPVYWSLETDSTGPVVSRDLKAPGYVEGLYAALLLSDGNSKVVQTVQLRKSRTEMSIVPVVEMRDVETDTILWQFESTIPGDRATVAFSPDGKSMAVAQSDRLVILDTATGKALKKIELDR